MSTNEQVENSSTSSAGLNLGLAPTFQLAPPEKFNFELSADWPKWKRRWDRFRIASGLSKKGEAEQVNTLIYCMGDEADEILASFKLTETEILSYQTVIDRFQAHFVLRHNTVYERQKFNARKQLEGESADTYVTALHTLAKHCGYGDLQEDLIRDQLVAGLLDRKLSRTLQLDAELTLTKAVNKARLMEQIARQQSEISKDCYKKEASVDALSKRGPRNFSKMGDRFKKDRKTKEYGHTDPPVWASRGHQYGGNKCQWCAKEKHDRNACPAKTSTCNKCGKRGHWAPACKSSQRLSEVEDESTYDVGFLGAIDATHSEDAWRVSIKIGLFALTMKIDTGADVTVVPFDWYQKHEKYFSLQQTKKVLKGPGETPLIVMGKMTATLQYKERRSEQTIFIVKNIRSALLGKPAIDQLRLISRVEGLDASHVGTLRPQDEYPELFEGLGNLQQPYEIRLKSEAEPFALATPRRVPIPLLDPVRKELDRMLEQGIVVPMDAPTDWCAPMVVVPKKDGKLRICVDYTELNKHIRREQYQMPSVEHTLAQVMGATVFTKLDANSGFWQVQLTEESSVLTTFITPFGRFRFRRLPFGITSAPEIFQKRLEQILNGTKGNVNLTDDILIFGRDQAEHDGRVREVLKKLKAGNVTLNLQKCVFSAKRVTFLGHEIDADGIHPDPEKIVAVQAFRRPQNVEDVRRFLGMVNFLGKFIPNAASMNKPLSELLSEKTMWQWDDTQERAFHEIKGHLSSDKVLALFDHRKETIVSADASSFAIGAVLLQTHNGQQRPVAYASRVLTPTEVRYAQIEKEALALTWACMRFKDFITGTSFHIQTDHKPLVSLFTKTPVDDLSPRIQRFRIRMMRYDYSISYVPGKELVVADALSRAPPEGNGSTKEDKELEDDVEAFVQLVVHGLPASDIRLKQIRREQMADRECSTVMQFVKNGWPDNKPSSPELQPYWINRHQLSVNEDLLMFGERLVIPKTLRDEMMQRIHEGHMGVVKCRERAKQSIWWPGLSSTIRDTVDKCEACISLRQNPREPLIPSQFPSRPWEVVALDPFFLNGKTYLLVTDYFSRYPEVALLGSLTAATVIQKLKEIFARHGIPNVVRSDSGTQFGTLFTSEFAEFAREVGFEHVTSSPRYSQSNGEIESAVKSVKQRLKKSRDHNMALLAYRTTPLENGYSPSQLLMGRMLRSNLPMTPQHLKPKWPGMKQLQQKEKNQRSKQKRNYDRRHRARDLRSLDDGEEVWIQGMDKKGTIVEQASTPRSYWVKTPSSVIRRNRIHLIPYGRHAEEEDHEEPTQPEKQPLDPPKIGDERKLEGYRTRYGRLVKKPDKLIL